MLLSDTHLEMQNDGGNREFYHCMLHLTEGARRRFLRAVERAIEAYFATSSPKKYRRGRMLKKLLNDLLLYGEVESLGLLNIAILEIHKSTAGK